MSTMVGSTHTEFQTDFALLNVVQRSSIYAGVSTFAASFRGGISAGCGSGYPRVTVRLERWDAAPPLDNMWEDFDELPFESLPGDGPLRAQGFEEASAEDGLDVEGLASARVRVLARGRYGTPEGGEPGAEEWVFQLYPEPGPPRPLAGGPRRLAGSSPWKSRINDGWDAALHAWRQTGWSALLSSSSEGFEGVQRALLRLHKPATPLEIAQEFVPNRIIDPTEPVVDPRMALETALALPQRGTNHLAEMTGIAQESIGDAIAALIQLQLLLPMKSGGETLLVPNPAPDFAWDRAGLSEEQARSLQIHFAERKFKTIADDIAFAAAWAGDAGLRTSVREMATRWSTSAHEVRGGMTLLEQRDRIEIHSSDNATNDASEIVLRSLMRPRRA